jgi:hypothetical protein
MGVDGVDCRRRTEDLVDDWAHDAGLVQKDEHVQGRAGLRSSAQAWEARNEGTAGEATKEVAKNLAKEIGPDVADFGLMEGHGAAAVAAASAGRAAGTAVGVGVAGGTVLGAYELYMHAWAQPHQKGDNIRALQHNDAVNVALATSLAFAPGFAADEKSRRPGIEKGTSQLLEQLNGKDAALKPILQGRADEGFVAQERAFAATQHLGNSPARGEAMQRWMKDNGFTDRQRNDVAFGKGVEYFNWIGTQPKHAGIDVSAEAKKVHDRQPPIQPFACRG